MSGVLLPRAWFVHPYQPPDVKNIVLVFIGHVYYKMEAPAVATEAGCCPAEKALDLLEKLDILKPAFT
jgi:hypothetical protein